MGLSRNQLATDEQIIRHMHTHVKALIWPVMALIVLAAAAGTAAAWIPASWPAAAVWALVAIGLAVLLVLVVVPVWRWRCNTWTLTDRRIIHREGILTRTGHDLPLTRINDVASEQTLVDRVLGCGSLKLTTAAEAPVYLRDIPDVNTVHVMLTELLFDDSADDE